MQVWLAMDPASRRVFAQDRPLTRADFHPGPAGDGWPQRDLDVDDATFGQVLAGDMPDDELDELHRGWWDTADPGGPPWPDY